MQPIRLRCYRVGCVAGPQGGTGSNNHQNVVEKADDDLRPIIPLKDKALAAYVLGASYLGLLPGFWYARTRGLRGL